MNTIFRGAWSSIMATSTMTMVMFEAHKLLPKAQKKPLPPAILTNDVLKEMNLQPNVSSEVQDELTMLSHYGYGMAGGVLYAALASHSSLSPLKKGLLFGLGVYAGSYYGLIPGLHLRPKGKEMSRERQWMMIAAHVVWGTSLAFAEKELKRKSHTLLDGRRHET